MTKLKGAAIGAGYFGQFHLDAWQRMDDVELVALCDLDRSRAEQAARNYGIARTYVDVAEMLDREQPDFVDIITRPDTHLSLVQAVAARGIAIICQKPLAPSFDESRQLIETTAAADVPLMVHENFRFQPWYREIRQLLDRGTIGDKLFTVSVRSRMGDGWQRDAYLARQPYFRSMPRFLIFETGVHFVDTFRYLVGEIDGVYASLRRLNQEIAGEDAAIVFFEFAGGAQGIWDANRYNESNVADPRYTFGELLLEGSGGSIRLYLDGRLTVQPLGQPERDQVYEHGKRGFGSDCVLATQSHFIECLQQQRPFETNGDSYLRTLEVQEAIYRSASDRCPVRGLVSTEVTHANR